MKVIKKSIYISVTKSLACVSILFVDDDERLQEELGDLIDDNPIEEDDSSSGSDNEKSGGTKRKRDDDDDELDDRLSEEDFELIEENLGIKMKVQSTY